MFFCVQQMDMSIYKWAKFILWMLAIYRWGFLSENVQAGPNCKLLRVIKNPA